MKATSLIKFMPTTKRFLFKGAVVLVLGIKSASGENAPTNHVAVPLTNSVTLAEVAKLTPTPTAAPAPNLTWVKQRPGKVAGTSSLQHPAVPAVTPIIVAPPPKK